MQVVILAGGLGTRISEETDYIPKPMVLIGEKPILLHIIKFYFSYGFTDFIICGGYKIKFISNFFKRKNKDQFGLIGQKKINIKIVNTGKNSNTGKRILNIKKYH
jgi:glucose-1-phosphate cytidylyltransferase